MIEHTVETDASLDPPRETHRILANAKALEVRVGGNAMKGPFTLSIDDVGCVVIDFPKAKTPAKAKPLKLFKGGKK